MTKVANAYYSTAVGHKEIDGLYQATFGIPGEPPVWVKDTNGKPKVFRTADEAALAGFRAMATKLNRSRQEQDFQVKGYKTKGGIKVFRSAERADEPTIDKVFGKK
jgi:hypothetical protein